MKFVISSESFKVPKNTIIHLMEIGNELRSFFHDKEFGVSIKEFFYVMKLVPKPSNSFEANIYFDEYVYQPRAKRLLISPLIKEYNFLIELHEEKEIYLFFAQNLLQDIEQMRNTKFKDFDTDCFILELQSFVRSKGWI